MKKSKYLISALLMSGLSMAAQNVVKVGKGSYASYTPLNMCYSEDHTPNAYGWKGDKSRWMQTRKLYLTERENQPIPTNDWWSNLMTEQYSGHLWSYPQMLQAQSTGLDIYQPSFWISDGTEMKSNTIPYSVPTPTRQPASSMCYGSAATTSPALRAPMASVISPPIHISRMVISTGR